MPANPQITETAHEEAERKALRREGPVWYWSKQSDYLTAVDLLAAEIQAHRDTEKRAEGVVKAITILKWEALTLADKVDDDVHLDLYGEIRSVRDATDALDAALAKYREAADAR